MTHTSLRQQAVHGFYWSFLERFGRQGIQFIVSVVLARLLEPKDFGILGMVSIFLAIAQSVVDSGFGTALVQKQNSSHIDESTVFWFNVIAGLVLSGLLCLAAPWISHFYGVPDLTLITQVLSLNLLINSFGIVQNSLLTKELKFRSRMKAVFASIVISGVIGIALAFRGFGVWALIAQGISMNLVYTLGLWLVSPWRPALAFSRSSFQALWPFGSNLLFTGLLNTFFDNIYFVIVGKLYSASQLGFYQRGKKLITLTSETLSQVVSQVNFPLLSRMQNDSERIRNAFTIVLQSCLFLVLPMMTGLAIAAPDLVVVLLGNKWMPTVPYLQILCVSGLLYPVHLLNVNVVLAMGRSDLHLRLEIIKKVLVVLAISTTYRYGVKGLLWGQVACSIASLAINTLYVGRLVDFGLWKQGKAVWKTMVSASLMGGCVWGVRHMIVTPCLPRLGLLIATGLASFFVAELLLRDTVLLQGLKALFRKFRGRAL